MDSSTIIAIIVAIIIIVALLLKIVRDSYTAEQSLVELLTTIDSANKEPDGRINQADFDRIMVKVMDFAKKGKVVMDDVYDLKDFILRLTKAKAAMPVLPAMPQVPGTAPVK